MEKRPRASEDVKGFLSLGNWAEKIQGDSKRWTQIRTSKFPEL
jgi:hypothetical protein